MKSFHYFVLIFLKLLELQYYDIYQTSIFPIINV